MKQTPLNLKPRFKLWLSMPEAEGVFGDGKWRLLKAIDKEKSLSSAARILGISYRKAWGDLQKAEKYLGVSLIEKQRGGKAGGGTSLTAEGKKWLCAYTRFWSEIEKTVKRAYTEQFERGSRNAERGRRKKK